MRLLSSGTITFYLLVIFLSNGEIKVLNQEKRYDEVECKEEKKKVSHAYSAMRSF